jgi:hypothetical protein
MTIAQAFCLLMQPVMLSNTAYSQAYLLKLMRQASSSIYLKFNCSL